MTATHGMHGQLVLTKLRSIEKKIASLFGGPRYNRCHAGKALRRCLQMLSARKLHLVAGFKVYGLDLRKAELDFYMMRYAAVTGISLLITGMGLVSLIKIEVPQYMRPAEEWFVWQVFSFYVCA